MRMWCASWDSGFYGKPTDTSQPLTGRGKGDQHSEQLMHELLSADEGCQLPKDLTTE